MAACDRYFECKRRARFTFSAPSTGDGIVPATLSTLSIDIGATVALATASSHTDRTVLLLSTLKNAGLLDMGGNDLILHGGDAGSITNQIAQGYSHGLWNGLSGISSSAAATSTNTSLGVELNDDGTADHHPLMTSFDSQTVTGTDVLVKYTYYGDVNLDGVVDGADYTPIDNGFNMGLTGWNNGDFNYDGVINGDDYTLIDNAFNTQGSVSFAAAPATPLARNTAQIADTTNTPIFSSRQVMPGNSMAILPSAQIGTTMVAGATDLRKRHRTVWLALEENNS